MAVGGGRALRGRGGAREGCVSGSSGSASRSRAPRRSALELLWMRSAGLVLGATAPTTATVLACYFAGLGLGAALGAPPASPSRAALRLPRARCRRRCALVGRRASRRSPATARQQMLARGGVVGGVRRRRARDAAGDALPRRDAAGARSGARGARRRRPARRAPYAAQHARAAWSASRPWASACRRWSACARAIRSSSRPSALAGVLALVGRRVAARPRGRGCAAPMPRERRRRARLRALAAGARRARARPRGPVGRGSSPRCCTTPSTPSPRSAWSSCSRLPLGAALAAGAVARRGGPNSRRWRADHRRGDDDRRLLALRPC